MTRSVLVRVGWMAGVGFFLVMGVWSFTSPRSFYDVLATYPPLNAHFLRDIGAFNLGIGAGLLAALRIRDGLAVALLATAAAAVFHAVSHIVDLDSGGKPTDPWLLALFALVVTGGAIARLKEMQKT